MTADPPQHSRAGTDAGKPGRGGARARAPPGTAAAACGNRPATSARRSASGTSGAPGAPPGGRPSAASWRASCRRMSAARRSARAATWCSAHQRPRAALSTCAPTRASARTRRGQLRAPGIRRRGRAAEPLAAAVGRAVRRLRPRRPRPSAPAAFAHGIPVPSPHGLLPTRLQQLLGRPRNAAWSSPVVAVVSSRATECVRRLLLDAAPPQRITTGDHA